MTSAPSCASPAPPADFSLLPGPVTFAALSRVPPRIRRQRYTGARAAGVRYEKRVQEYLLHHYDAQYLPSPWIRYQVLHERKFRWCQPDGLLFEPRAGRVLCIEVKHSHTSRAWWQLNKLYLPVLRKMLPQRLWWLDCCEIVRWYDPDTPFPEPVQLISTPTRENSRFKVHIWKP